MRRCQHGFTFVELVVGIVITSIVVGFMAMFMVAPMNSYMQQERRTELVDSANSAMRMIENDVRRALPASVRMVNSGTNRAMELLYADVSRYRQGTGATDLNRAGDTSFNALGCFVNTTPAVSNVWFLVVGHGIGTGNAYTHAGVATTTGTQVTVGACAAGAQVVSTNTNYTFPTDSTTRSVYLVTEPVSYVCNLTAGTMKRFSGYTIATNQATRATEAQLLASGAVMALVATDVTACTFAATAETLYIGGLVRARMTFARNGETFTAFDQIQVANRR